jgi:D-amino peptidase
MEGSTGIVSPEQVKFGQQGYAFGCRMQLHDTLAAVRAALSWGADSVTVNDSHDRMINLDPSMFPSGVSLISGTPKILGMVEGVTDHDAAIFMGYHAMAGTEKAVLDHTYHSKVVYGLKVNGIRLGETGLNALFCGALGVPETSDLISEAVKKALDAASSGRSPVLTMEAPFRAELSFHTTAQADAAGMVPGSERISGRTMVFSTEDIFEIRRWYSSSIDCASLAEN